jgi:hypothetical protein
MDSKRKMKNFSAEMNPNTSTFTEWIQQKLADHTTDYMCDPVDVKKIYGHGKCCGSYILSVETTW